MGVADGGSVVVGDGVSVVVGESVAVLVGVNVPVSDGVAVTVGVSVGEPVGDGVALAPPPWPGRSGESGRPGCGEAGTPRVVPAAGKTPAPGRGVPTRGGGRLPMPAVPVARAG